MRQQKERTARYGLETAPYRTLQLWSLVPADLKSLPNVNLLKSKSIGNVLNVLANSVRPT